MGSGEAKELICVTYGHEQRGRRGMTVGGWVKGREEQRGEKSGTTVIA